MEVGNASGRKKINCSIGKTGHVLATRLYIDGADGREIASASLLLLPPPPIPSPSTTAATTDNRNIVEFFYSSIHITYIIIICTLYIPYARRAWLCVSGNVMGPSTYRPNRFGPSRFVPRHHLVCTCSWARCNGHDVNCTVWNLLIRNRQLINVLAGVTYRKAICSTNASSDYVVSYVLCQWALVSKKKRATVDAWRARDLPEGYTSYMYLLYLYYTRERFGFGNLHTYTPAST